MKLVKMITAILMVLALAAAILAGCSKPNDAGEISDYDSQAFIPVGNTGETIGGESTEGSESTANPGGFVVSEKKYDFEGNNLVVLNVENQTSENYSIAIHGTYLDENGEILKEETKTFEGFAAGWKNHFFFVPKIPFERFTYTIDTEEYAGECYAAYFSSILWRTEEAIVEDTQAYLAALKEWDGEIGDEGMPQPEDWQELGVRLYLGHRHSFSEPLMIKEGAIFLTGDGDILAVFPQLHYGEIKADNDGWGCKEYFSYSPFDTSKLLEDGTAILFSITEARPYDPDKDMF